MKDPRSGPIAVVTLVLVLLLKFTALLALIETHNSVGLLLAPLIARGAMLGLFLGTPYVRAGGLGQALADHLPRKTGRQVLLVSALACVVFAGVSGFIALLVAAVGFFWLRHLMIRRLGGTTGDTAGALLELLEVLVLLAVVVGPA
jgi:adenosylcobinamide-GDP ribazoletransferase